MNESLEHPVPVPQLPTKSLWMICIMPSLMTLTGITVAIIGNPTKSEFNFMMIPWVAIPIIIVCLACFNSIAAKRYRGQSKVFLGWAFFLGQIITFLSLWVGFGLLFIN